MLNDPIALDHALAHDTSIRVCVCVCACTCAWMSAQSCPTLCNPMDCSPPGPSVYGTFQARILEWVAISSRKSSWSVHQICVSSISCIGRQILYHWVTWEAHKYVVVVVVVVQPLSHVQLFVTSWTAVCQAPLSFTVCRSLLKSMSIEFVMLSNHLIFISMMKIN